MTVPQATLDSLVRTVLLAILVCSRGPTWVSVPDVTVMDTQQIATQSLDPAGSVNITQKGANANVVLLVSMETL